MNYYNEIKTKLLNNEVYEKVKDYSKERHRVLTYFEIGRLLHEAGKHYGESIIKNYSLRLTKELGSKYNERTLRRMRQFYEIFSDTKWSTVSTKSNKIIMNNHKGEILSVNLYDTNPSLSNRQLFENSSMATKLINENDLNKGVFEQIEQFSNILATNLTWSHYSELLTLKDSNEINYYTNICISQSLTTLI